MRIGVEEAVNVHLHCPGLTHTVHKDITVHTVLVHRLKISDRKTVAKLHHYNSGRDVLRNRRRDDSFNVAALHIHRYFLQSLCLQTHIKLLPHRGLPLVNNLPEVVVWLQPSDNPAESREVVQIAFHLLVYTAVLNLKHHLLPSLQNCPVHLRDGRGAQGRPVDGAEAVLPIRAELLLERRVDVRPWMAWNGVLKGRQLAYVRHRHDVCPGAQELANLDPKPTESDHRVVYPFCVAHVRCLPKFQQLRMLISVRVLLYAKLLFQLFCFIPGRTIARKYFPGAEINLSSPTNGSETPGAAKRTRRCLIPLQRIRHLQQIPP
mmetsp:Transcript_18874/g.45084  ORF Transcript_18874/g.45084 Transcript_18874/m.45084 type:complete len:320 (+) Transcript_18874:902-1861(+)